MNQIIWIDVRDDKTSNSTHMRATANGKTADVWTLPRDGSGRDWAVEVDGNLLSQKGYFTEKAAFAAAKKALEKSAVAA